MNSKNAKKEDILSAAIGKENTIHNFFTRCPHELVPRINSKTKEFILNSEPDFDYKCSLQIPLYLQNLNNINLPDDVGVKLVENKETWREVIKSTKKSYNCKSYRKVKNKIVLENKYCLSKLAFDFIQQLKRDPDKYFNDNYNWYFTNGCLKIAQLNNKKYLFHTQEDNLSHLSINKLSEKPKTKLKSQKVKKNDLNETIYEIETNYFNNNFFVGTRHKKKFILNKFEDDDFDQICIFKNNKPLTSVAFYKNELAFSDVKKSIRIYDIETNKSKNLIEIKHEKLNNWSQIKYHHSSMLYLDQNIFYKYDDRDLKNSYIRLSNSQYLQPCDYFSFLTPSEVDPNNYIYIGSYHSVILVDLRNTKQVMKKWTHCMKSVPLLSRAIAINKTEELLCFSSMLSNEKCILSFGNSVAPPKYLPSFLDTLYQAKLNGYCLNPFSNLNKRCAYSTVGLEVFKDFVLSQNSLGDLFYQKLNCDTNFVGDEFYKKLDETCETCTESDKLFAMNLCFNGVNVLNENKIFGNKKTNKKISTSPDSKIEHVEEEWQRSLSDLNEYVDILAEEILLPWNLNDSSASLDVSSKENYVHSWISENNFESKDSIKDQLELTEYNIATQNATVSLNKSNDRLSSTYPMQNKNNSLIKKRKNPGF